MLVGDLESSQVATQVHVISDRMNEYNGNSRQSPRTMQDKVNTRQRQYKTKSIQDKDNKRQKRTWVVVGDMP